MLQLLCIPCILHVSLLRLWLLVRTQTAYNPLSTVDGVSVYESIGAAFPAFGDPDFNGGNVLVVGHFEPKGAQMSHVIRLCLLQL